MSGEVTDGDDASDRFFGSSAVGQAMPPISLQVTAPDSIICHLIEDWELDALTEVSRPILRDIAMAAWGGFVGLLPSLLDMATSGEQLNVWRGSLLAITASCATLAITTTLISRRDHDRAAKIKARVRARTPWPQQPHTSQERRRSAQAAR